MNKLLLVMVIAIVLLLSASGVVFYLLGSGDLPVDPQWEIDPTKPAPDSVTVRYSGTSTLLFTDGETTWMTDGWFSRPSFIEVLAGKIEPDLKAIEWGLKKNEVTNLDAVFVMHSHFDHAMDSPEVARRTGALLMGSQSTANIARGWGLPEQQIRVVKDREVITLGKFTLTPIESDHYQFTNDTLAKKMLSDPDIVTPLMPPVSSFDYRLGKVYVLHVSHPKGSFLIIASAGYRAGQLAGINVDKLFLGVGGLGLQSESYQDEFWGETVGEVGADDVMLIHWDSLTTPITDEFRGPLRGRALVAKGTRSTLDFLKMKEEQNPSIKLGTLPRFGEVVLFH